MTPFTAGGGSPDSRGVSDVVGFVVVFGVVATSIALTYTFGLAALGELQHAESMENGGRAFDVLADNMADVHDEQAPGRSTELQFASGELSTTGEVALVVNVTSGGPQSDFTVVPISYRDRETSFHYVTGAVVRTDRDAAVMVNDPPFALTDERVVLSVVDTRAAGDTASIGGGTIRVTAERQGPSQLVLVNDSASTVRVSVVSPRYRAWERYFDREPCGTVTVAPAENTATCEIDTNAVYVRRTAVSVGVTP